MLNALRYNVQLSRPKVDRSISKLDVEHALQDEKKIIRIVVLVPNKFVCVPKTLSELMT